MNDLRPGCVCTLAKRLTCCFLLLRPKIFCVTLLTVCITKLCFTQPSPGKAGMLINSKVSDSNLVIAIINLADYYTPTNTLLKRKRKSAKINLHDYYTPSEGDTAFLLVQKGIKVAKQIGFQKGEALLLMKLGEINVIAGDYATSLQSYILALDIMKKLKREDDLGDCLHKIALLYKDQSELRRSLFYFRQEREVVQATGNVESLVWNTIDMADVFVSMKIFDSARIYRDEAHKVALQYYSGGLPGDFLNNLGDLYQQLGEHEDAVKYYLQSVNSRYNNDPQSVAQSALGAAKALENLGKIESSFYYSRYGLYIAQTYKLPATIMICTDYLSNLFRKANRFDSAFYYRELTDMIKDSIFSRQKIRSFENISFANQLEELEMAQQEARSREYEVFTIIISAVIIIAILTFVIVYFKIKEKHLRGQQKLLLEQKQNEQKILLLQNVQAELEMKALRAQMNPHFIFNSLNSINRFILKKDSDQAAEYLLKFSKLMRIILQNSQVTLISLESELESLELYLSLEQLRFDHQFSYEIIISPGLDVSFLKVPPLIVQPYVENAIWHGLMHKEGKGELRIEVLQDDVFFYIKVIDNGIGRKKAQELRKKPGTDHKPMGLNITANRIAIMNNLKSNRSSVEIRDIENLDGSAAGTEVTIKLPMNYD